MHWYPWLTAWAASAPGDATGVGTPTPLPSYGGLLIKTLLALIVVVIVAWVLLRWGLKWLLPAARAEGKLIRVVARHPLSARRALLVIEVGNRYFLLGSTEQSISLIVELDRSELAPFLEAEAEAAANRKSFADVLARVIGRQKPSDDPPAAPDEKPPTKEDDRAGG